MFDFFKKQKKESLLQHIKNNVVNVIELQKNKYSSDIEMIHNEFDIASDKLVEQAIDIINTQSKIDEDKISRLTKFGFAQVKEVIVTNEIQHKIKLSKEQIELVSYYQKEYPRNKFITEEQVKHICKKYNLVFGDVSRFKGFVPEKNLREIEQFKLKKNENKHMIIEAYDKGKLIGEFFGEDLEIKFHRDYYHIYSKHEPSAFNYSFQQLKSDLVEKGEFYGCDYQNLFGLKDLDFLQIKIKNKSLKICAPIKDMDMSGMTVENGYKMINIPDPVVLHSVKGGYLIVTKWGDEASDEILIHDNHKNLIQNQSNN